MDEIWLYADQSLSGVGDPAARQIKATKGARANHIRIKGATATMGTVCNRMV